MSVSLCTVIQCNQEPQAAEAPNLPLQFYARRITTHFEYVTPPFLGNIPLAVDLAPP